MQEVDVITICTPKIKKTTDIINDDNLHKLKDGVRLVNVARGRLFNEESIEKGLKSRKMAKLFLNLFNLKIN